jgi:hypothetical protein
MRLADIADPMIPSPIMPTPFDPMAPLPFLPQQMNCNA